MNITQGFADLSVEDLLKHIQAARSAIRDRDDANERDEEFIEGATKEIAQRLKPAGIRVWE